MNEFKSLDLLKSLWGNFVEYLPNFLGGIVVIFFGWIAAKIISRGITKLLSKLKIDRLSDMLNEIEFISKTHFTINFGYVLGRAAYYLIMIVVFMVAADIINVTIITELLSQLIDYIPKLIVAGVILIMGLILAEYVRKIIHAAASSIGIPSAKLIASFVFYFFVINVLVSALTQAGVNTEFISGNISIIIGGFVLAFAIGYGLASKYTVSNYLASFYTQNKIAEGYTIRIQDREGVVTKIDKSAITLLTNEDTELIIPLNYMTKETIEVLNIPSEE